MQVQAQLMAADLDKNGSMFDFQASFHIINPLDTNIIAPYLFDKNSTRKQEKESAKIDKEKLTKQMELYKGVIPANINDSKPFKFNTLTNGSLFALDAIVDLDSFNSDSFTITVSLVKKKGNSVNLTYIGAKPSWLTDKALFHGKLTMARLKDVGPPVSP